jgi:antitoxin (DNA-binding transcriptional repressor) of toxin-antitoxin stability system
MAAGYFKTNGLAVMAEVQAKREAVVITKHGKPVAKHGRRLWVRAGMPRVWQSAVSRCWSWLLVEKLSRLCPRAVVRRIEGCSIAVLGRYS